MRNTTLVIMAAGIGSRFGGGGVKQLTAFGPTGEIIMDYSIHDAIEVGFDKIVFVIRRSMEQDFKEIIGDRIAKKIPVDYAFQEIEDVPEGFTVPENRQKPWGTGQAILACKDVVKEPFAVINADDYYGKDAFQKVHDFLVRVEPGKEHFSFCMAGFILRNTLSEHGGVTRGLCRLNERNELLEIRETKDIIKIADGAAVYTEKAKLVKLDPDTLVSMNFWGFTPDFFDELATGFARFLGSLSENREKAEYLLPTIVDQLLKEERVDLTVLPSGDKWFGVTFREDVPVVRASIQALIDEGVYPKSLF